MIMTIRDDHLPMQIPKLVSYLFENVSFCLGKNRNIHEVGRMRKRF